MTSLSLVPKTTTGWILAAVFLAGLALAVADHWAHLLGVLPYLVILACPLMHLFMHHGHGGRGRHGVHGHADRPDGPGDPTAGG